jgi:hypothetical protein
MRNGDRSGGLLEPTGSFGIVSNYWPRRLAGALPDIIHNERLKLVATPSRPAIMTAGLFVSAGQYFYGFLQPTTDMALVYGTGGICVGVGLGIHLCGRWTLGALQMTHNQIVAMLFPLLGLVVAGGVAVFTRKPWNEKKRKPAGPDAEIVEALHRAETILPTPKAS